MADIKIGTCGYRGYRPGKNWKETYNNKLEAFSDTFNLVELNRTFYKLPMLKTAERWRGEVKAGFEFTLKAWQAITHTMTSPTWRKRSEKLTQTQKRHFGNFRSNEEVMKAWDQTRQIADALRATVCVLQAPASFGCNGKNENNMHRFFDKADRGDMAIGWEPRGDWNAHPERIKDMCETHGLIHIVDLMRREPLSEHPVSYIRLHGLNEKEFDYAYDYSDTELKELVKRIKKLGERHDTVYCMFNNDAMYDNARTLMKFMDT
ncbi:MAG: DUF72 domain-containing protein [Deltaproteobacteria bacterium]|nr:DUF72 domain-containing protein [Deltaproteobacteria bacterium]